MFPVLEQGDIDILSRSVTQTTSPETAMGMVHTGPNDQTGQGFMGHAETGVEKIEDLDGATICVLSGR